MGYSQANMIAAVLLLSALLMDCSTASTANGKGLSTSVTVTNAPGYLNASSHHEPGFENPARDLSVDDVVDYLNRFHSDLQATDRYTTDNVCVFTVAKIGNPPQSVLLVSLDVNGRMFCRETDAISRNGRELRLAYVRTSEEDTTAGLVRVPEGASRPYLFVSSDISPYEGASGCVASVPRIYDLKDGRLVEVSQHFPVFYRKQIEAETSRVSLKDKGFDICREMATDKMKRIARIDDRAGFQTALLWMHADDTSTREKAVSVFGDIRDAPALEALKKMTKDQDRLVAEEATMQIKNIESRDPSVDQPGFVDSIRDKP